MTRTHLLAIPVLFCLAVSASLAGGALPIGATIPMQDVTMKNVDGEELNLKSIVKPAGTLVVFTCNHCPFAKQWESRIVELGNTYEAKGIGVIAINANDPKEYEEDSFSVMQQRAKEKGMEFPYVVDATSNVARAFGGHEDPRGVPLRQEHEARLSRRDRRQRQGSVENRKCVPEARARGRPFRRTRACSGNEIDRLHYQIPLVMTSR